MRRAAGIVAAGLMLVLSMAAPAAADHNRSVPAGLTSSVFGTNFKVHYNPSTATQSYALAGLADFEEAYGKLVGPRPPTGANAGLEAPIDDADGLIDVYLSAPADAPTFSGGVVYPDTFGVGHDPGTAYVFMTPNLSRSNFRFRAGHELMHVIQNSYTPAAGAILTESTANWAAEWALPDIDPGDNPNSRPQVPLDCAFGQWNETTNAFVSSGGTACGLGYQDWLFYQYLSETLGVDVIHGLLDQMRSTCPGGCTRAQSRQFINAELNDQGGPGLRGQYAAYMRELIDPTDWTSSAPATIHTADGPPAHTAVTQGVNANDTVVVDHLGTKYVRIKNFGGFQPSGPDDKVRIQFTRPAASLVTSTQVHRRLRSGPALEPVGLAGGPSVGFDAEFGADPAQALDFWIPFTNDTETTDDLSFGYTVTWQAGTPTPPPNDERGAAQTVARGVEATVNNVYAGGNGAAEAPLCPSANDASRGTWYRFTAPNNGSYSFSAVASDFTAVLSVYDGTGFEGCAGPPGTSAINVRAVRGRAYDVYVGRHRDTPATAGTTVRLLVNGPAAPPDPTPDPGQQQPGGGQQQPPPDQGGGDTGGGQQTPQPQPQPPVVQPITPQGGEGPTAFQPTAACTKAQRAYTSASKAYSKAKKAAKKAKGKVAKKRANAKLKKLKKKLASAKRARDKACSS